MDKQLFIKNLTNAINTSVFPTVKLWNRLEARPWTDNFDRALKAEVRDALWMLTKQWQMGEFAGDDAGSPILAKIHLTTTQLTKFKIKDNPVEPFDNKLPLETKVEQQPVQISWNKQTMHVDLRMMLGRRWLKLLALDPLISGLAGDYKKKYAFVLPAQDKESAYIYAHQQSWQQLAAIGSERMMDGGELYLHLKENNSNKASDGIVMSGAQGDAVNALAKDWMLWFEKEFFLQPDAGKDGWIPSQLEYQCAASAPVKGKEKVVTADEYYSGNLDWYCFDIDPVTATLGNTNGPAQNVEEEFTRSFLPTSITFNGMPNTRWWEFEDGKTNFGNIKPSTSELAKLLLIEFGLVYANDWFLVPFNIPVGTLSEVKGLTVTNTFGERFWIEASGRGKDDNWHRWNMYNLNVKGNAENQNADSSLLLLPTVPKVQESDPVEEIVFIRDEVANLVWGIETGVPIVTGRAVPGKQIAEETTRYHRMLIDQGSPIAPALYKAEISYDAMTSVPENWIPFISVHVTNSNRETRLQRAAMLRILEGDPAPTPDKIRPQTTSLRFGIETKESYYINEEEIPRAGIKLTKSYQRTRWNDGKVFLWAGMRKQTGRGEGSSGLAFDQIKDVKKG
jgi:hypothetical protein